MTLLRNEVVQLLNVEIWFRLELLECDIHQLFAEGVEEKLMKRYNIKYNEDLDQFEQVLKNEQL